MISLVLFCFTYSCLSDYLLVLALAESSCLPSQSKDASPEIQERDAKVPMVAWGDNVVMINSYKEAINLIGSFDNIHQSSYVDCSPNHGIRKSEVSSELGLSLRRSEECFTGQRTEERHTLKHSDASAFSRCVCSSALHSINCYLVG